MRMGAWERAPLDADGDLGRPKAMGRREKKMACGSHASVGKDG
jgi:hypothetical protein